ncbi:MAG TPA: tetratricopeptide repeat protein [Candidatus Baltobacteraceae bacterium]|nr:tetratricopeptide repeat protein [Candidatus Baltobacteraceae bacterium]
MGLPPRIAVPVLVAFAAVFLGVMGYFLRIGFGTTGSAFGPSGTVAQQGDARIVATPAPIATDPPGTFTVPQTGTGPIAGASALPGASTGGGGPAGAPPAPVMQELAALRARLARNPNDLAALVQLGDMEFDAQKYDKAGTYFAHALALDPGNPDVRTDYATTLHETGHDLAALEQLNRVLKERPGFRAALFNRGVVLQAIGRRTDAIADFRAYLKHAPPDDARADNARAALQQLQG